MLMSRFTLPGKVAIVTGCGQGNGKSVALGFAEAGADIVVDDIVADRAEQTAKEVRALGRKALILIRDVTIKEQVEDMAQQAVKEFGKIDILVNNVGGPLGFKHLLDEDEGAFNETLKWNLGSTFVCCKIVGKIMVAQREGVIINTSSMAGLGFLAGAIAYGAAKAAIVNLTRTLSLELAPYNIRVNAIMPGVIGGPQALAVIAKDPGGMERRLKRIPLGKLGEPDDIATTAIYLASPASKYVTGVTIPVMGGILPSSEVYWGKK